MKSHTVIRLFSAVTVIGASACSQIQGASTPKDIFEPHGNEALAIITGAAGRFPLAGGMQIAIRYNDDAGSSVAYVAAAEVSGGRVKSVPLPAHGDYASLRIGLADNEKCVVDGQYKILGAPNDQISTSFHRIDVADMKIARPDGSTYVVAGTYDVTILSICAASPDVIRLPGTFATSTGYDVASGHYEVAVTAKDENGRVIVQKKTFTFGTADDNVTPSEPVHKPEPNAITPLVECAPSVTNARTVLANFSGDSKGAVEIQMQQWINDNRPSWARVTCQAWKCPIPGTNGACALTFWGP